MLWIRVKILVASVTKYKKEGKIGQVTSRTLILEVIDFMFHLFSLQVLLDASYVPGVVLKHSIYRMNKTRIPCLLGVDSLVKRIKHKSK